jgi:signal transduction histidine kinase
VLGVLTPVGKGDIRRNSTTLRTGAATALDVINNMDGREAESEAAVRLDHLLEKIATEAGVDRLLAPTTVPGHVAIAFAGATEAALDNVIRHAQATRTQLALTSSARQVRVEVTDDGRGFDPKAFIPLHRYGLREAILGRMTSVGGGADVESAPGAGTRVRMWWRVDG